MCNEEESKVRMSRNLSTVHSRLLLLFIYFFSLSFQNNEAIILDTQNVNTRVYACMRTRTQKVSLYSIPFEINTNGPDYVSSNFCHFLCLVECVVRRSLRLCVFVFYNPAVCNNRWWR